MKHSILILLAMMLGVFAPSSYAADIAPQSCDAQYWRQLSARAWLEAEREIMQNQNLIFKPDSVLQYACFDRALNINAHAGGDLFVHTDYFGEKIIKRESDYAMHKALNAVVYTSLSTYLSNNYAHTDSSGAVSKSGSSSQVLLGGRADFMEAGNSRYSPTSPLSKLASYECQIMSEVWKTAKCSNFVDNSAFEDTDGFYPFEAIKKHGDGSKDVAGYADTIKETRKFPSNLECSSDSQGVTTWDEQIQDATNRSELYKFQVPLGEIFKEVNEKLEPGNCGGQRGIYTGVTVITGQGEGHQDGICTNPGCSYTSGGTCVGAAASDAGSAGGG